MLLIAVDHLDISSYGESVNNNQQHSTYLAARFNIRSAQSAHSLGMASETYLKHPPTIESVEYTIM
jgi:hypothetical protein